MRLQILSDMHIDIVGGFVLELADGVDAVLVPGDVCESATAGMAFLRTHIPPPMPIVMTLGNHEFFGHHIVEERRAAREAAREHGITLLDDTTAVIGGVRFPGGTLWTDYCLYGEHRKLDAMQAAQKSILDYKHIGLHAEHALPFTPDASRALHRQARAFLEGELARPFAGPTVVVTHHAPHPGSTHARFAGNPINPAFISDLSALIAASRPALWVHGHVHNSFDYRVGDTRIVCNPRGYGRENPEFDPAFVVEI